MGHMTQHVRCGFDTAAAQTINLLKGGNSFPENIMMQYEFSSTIDAEDLNVTGKMLGSKNAVTALVTTEIAGTASLVGLVDLSSAAKGFWQLTFTLDTTITGEYCDVWITTW